MGKKERVRVADAIVSCIEAVDINHVFCVPGESYLAVLDALYDATNIKVITTRHESGAAFMAEAYAKNTLKTGVVMATRGVGATNLAIGVHTAMQDSTPLVVFLGQVHRKNRFKEGFQEIDFVQFFQPIAKWTVEITDAERTYELVSRAFQVAQSGRPGPVVVSLPEDLLTDYCEKREVTIYDRQKPVLTDTDYTIFSSILQRAKRPLLIAGGGIKRANAEKELLAFSEKFALPTFVSFRRHDIFPHDHPHYLGHLGLDTTETMKQAIGRADTIIAIGTRLSEITSQNYSLVQAHHDLIHIDIEADMIGKVFTPKLAIVSDAKEALHKLLQANINISWRNWATSFRKRYEQENRLKHGHITNMYERAIYKLTERLKADYVITNDAGNFAGWLHKYFPFTKPHTYVGPTSGAMGYGLPAAIGTKLAYPHKTVINLAGDGGFMMTAQELETAVRYHLPHISIVFNNNMYGTIRMHQEMYYPDRVVGTDLGEVNFAQLAQSCGAKGFTVKTEKQFDDVFTEALNMDEVVVIDVKVEKKYISTSGTIDDIKGKR